LAVKSGVGPIFTAINDQRPSINNNMTNKNPLPHGMERGGSKQQNKQTEAASTKKSSTASATPRKTQ
jgi:hypothetical protein